MNRASPPRVRTVGRSQRRSGARKAALIAFLCGFLVLNVLSYFQARAMTHFTPGGLRTGQAESLSWLAKIKVLFAGVNLPKAVNHQTPAQLGLSYEVRTFPGARGCTLEAWWIPQASSRGIVVLFPGYNASKESLLPAAAVFHDWGYADLLIDFYGSGGSTGSETSIGYHEGADVSEAVRYARDLEPGRPVILFGSSMGAVASLRAICAHQCQPDAIILECPFDRLLSTVKHRFEAMHLPSFPCAQLLVFWGGVQQGFNGFTHNPVEYARRVRCPALLLTGELDPRVSPAEVEKIHRNLPPGSPLKVFKGLRHESYLAAQPEGWKGAVREFLDNSLSERSRGERP